MHSASAVPQFLRGHLKGRVLVVALFMLGCGGLAKAGEAAVDPAESAMSELALQLFTPDFCKGADRRSIGIWAFDVDHIPVSAGVADRAYASALSTLIARRPSCADVLDGSAIRDIAEHLKRTGAFREAGENPLLALERANRSVSILAQGDIFAQDGAIFISFRAVESASTVVLAQTKPWRLPDTFVRSAAADAALSLDVALQQAANQLVARAGHLDVLVPAGVYYEDTGAQPPLARYLLDGLLGALESEAANLVSTNKLRVISPDLPLVSKTSKSTTIDDFDPLTSVGSKTGESVYELTGRYWRIGDAIDLKLVLRSQSGETVSWQGRVRLEGLPDLAVSPKNLSRTTGQQGESAFLLQMTSPRGAAPYYRPGEELTVFLRTDRDAWLSCFYVDTDGNVIKVLPNKFQTDQSGDSRIASGILRARPDARHDPFKFQFTATTMGEEILQCFATTRDPAPYLPLALRAAEFDPLSPDLVERLGAIFHSLPEMLVAEAALTVTVGNDSPSPTIPTGVSSP